MSGWVVETLVATTALMVVVLLVRAQVAAMFGPRIAYLLWLLPALRMVLPPLPDSFGPAPIEQIPALAKLSFPDLPTIDMSALQTGAQAVPAVPSIDWPLLLLGIWLGGAMLMMAWHLFAYHRFVRSALRESVDLPEMDSNGIEVCASRLVEGPFAAGVLMPTIVLPHDYRTRYSAEELRLAMTHEAVHHRRGDLSINMVALAMLSLHWFNPVAWRAWRAFRADQELACDAVVLQGATVDERCSYATALVKSACPRTPVAACSLNPRDQLKTRLRMMRDAPERGMSGRVLALVLVSGGLAITASGGIAAETTAGIREKMQVRMIEPVVSAVSTGMDGIAEIAHVAAPIPPVPPVRPARLANVDAPVPPAPPVPPIAPIAPALSEMPAVPTAPRAPIPPSPPAMPVVTMSFDEHGMAMRIAADAAQNRAEQIRLAVTTARKATACNGKSGALISIADDTRNERRNVTFCGRGISDAEVRKVQLNAMVQARKSLIESRKIERERLREALEGLDAEIERLKDSIEDMH
jgi:beta-lactamase regulating signal transducer with metallopeptidase domain